MADPVFDPNKPATPVSSEVPQFDPNKPATEVPKAQKITPVESVIAGASQGISFGFDDEAIGAVRAAIGKATGDDQNYSDLYKKYRDEQRNFTKQAQQDNPWSFFAGNAAGTVGSAIAVPFGAIGEGATAAARIGRAATLGGVTGAGLSENNPLDSPTKAFGFVKDVGEGAAIGGALQGAGEGLGTAARTLIGGDTSGIRNFSQQKALAAAGFMAKDLNKLSPAQQEAIGSTLLDKKVVTALSSLNDVADAAQGLKEDAGNRIGEALKNVDNMVVDAKQRTSQLPISAEDKTAVNNFLDENFSFNMKRVGQRIKSEIIQPNANDPTVSGELNKLGALADDFESKPPQSLEFGNTIKGRQGAATKFNSDTIPQMFKKEIYGIIKDELDQTVAKTGNLAAGLRGIMGDVGEFGDIETANSAASEAYQSGKNDYMAGKVAENAATDRAAKVANNRTAGLSTYIAGAAGLAHGGLVEGAALGALNKVATRFGAPLQAVAADKLADGIEAVVSQSPRLLRQISPILEDAASKGNKALIGVHLELMNSNPQYKYLMLNQGNNPQPNAFQRRLDNSQGSH